MKEQKELWFDPLPTIQAFELVEVFTICGSLAKMVAARVEDIPDYLLQHFIDAEVIGGSTMERDIINWVQDGSHL